MAGLVIEERDHVLTEEKHQLYNHKTLPLKVQSNTRGLIWYRSDYELRWLRVAKKARCYWERLLVPQGIKRALRGVEPETAAIADVILNQVKIAEIASKELDRWCERERSLLRIAKPAAEKVKIQKFSDRLDQDKTATLVEVQATESQQNPIESGV